MKIIPLIFFKSSDKLCPNRTFLKPCLSEVKSLKSDSYIKKDNSDFFCSLFFIFFIFYAYDIKYLSELSEELKNAILSKLMHKIFGQSCF